MHRVLTAILCVCVCVCARALLLSRFGPISKFGKLNSVYNITFSAIAKFMEERRRYYNYDMPVSSDLSVLLTMASIEPDLLYTRLVH
jgi:hypothetical protein